jgi:stage V sporulation protein B
VSPESEQANPVGESAPPPNVRQMPGSSLETGTSFNAGLRLLAVRVLAYGILFIVQLVVSRALGPVGRARYALPLNLANIVWVITALSLDLSTGAMLARREVSFEEVSRFLAAATLILGSVGGVATCAVGLLVAPRLVAGASLGTIALAALVVPLQMAAMMCVGVITRLGALRAFGFATITGASVQLAFVAVLIALGHLTPNFALVGVALGWCGIALPLMVMVRRYVGPRALIPALPARLLRRAVLGGLALQPATLGLYLNWRVDLLIVSALANTVQTGLYSLSSTLASTVFLAASTLSQSALKTQTNAPLEDANRYTVAFIKRSSVFTALAATVIAAAAWPLIRYLFGHAWVGSVAPFAILAFAAITFTVEYPARVMLIRMERSGQVGLIACAGAVLNVVSNLVLVPVAGIIGAAIASLVSYSLYSVSIGLLFLRASSALRREREQSP